MKITRLVILFNRNKIILGLMLVIVLIVLSGFVSSRYSTFFLILGSIIVLNIVLAIFASYMLYDKSSLFKPTVLFRSLNIKQSDKAILLHASFDPISRKLEKIFKKDNLQVYNIYGNRHENEKSIEITNKVFPPHDKQEIVDPVNLPNKTKSIDYLIAVTSLHEILSQERRIKFFIEAKRILKDKGTLIICEQTRSWVNFLFFNIRSISLCLFK